MYLLHSHDTPHKPDTPHLSYSHLIHHNKPHLSYSPQLTLIYCNAPIILTHHYIPYLPRFTLHPLFTLLYHIYSASPCLPSCPFIYPTPSMYPATPYTPYLLCYTLTPYLPCYTIFTLLHPYSPITPLFTLHPLCTLLHPNPYLPCYTLNPLFTLLHPFSPTTPLFTLIDPPVYPASYLPCLTLSLLSGGPLIM